MAAALSGVYAPEMMLIQHHWNGMTFRPMQGPD